MTAVPRPPRLPPDELAAALSGLPLWSGDGEGIRRSVELPGFPDAVAALVRIAFVAEQLDHHPDVDLRWRTLHLTLVTHSAGGVTELDLELARRIDALFPG
jgi:4a-hydroxytetrahydrobiopterin dehydratase